MEQSILTSTKQLIGLVAEDDEFDLDVLTLINAAFATMDQVGIDPGFIEDATATWDQLGLDPRLLALVKPYVVLKVGMAWDPPTMSFLVDAKKEQIAEFEWRISNFREMQETTP